MRSMTEGNPNERELTGKHVLIMLLVFFGLIVGSGIWFTVMAVQSFRGEDVEKSYRQGINYNTTLAERAAQAELGWSVAVNIVGEPSEREMIVKVLNGERTLYDLDYRGRLRHPVDTDLDRPVEFRPMGDGTARVNLSGLVGQWTLEADAMNGDDIFHFTYPIDLR